MTTARSKRRDEAQNSDTPVRDELSYRAHRLKQWMKFMVFGGALFFGPFIALMVFRGPLTNMFSEQAFGAMLFAWVGIGAVLTNVYGRKF